MKGWPWLLQPARVHLNLSAKHSNWFGKRVLFNSLLPVEVLGWLVLPGIAKDHHGMTWVGKDFKTHLIPDPLPWAETPPSRPGCSSLALSTS